MTFFNGTIFHGVGAPIPENIIKRNGVDCVDPWDIYNHRGGNLWFFYFVALHGIVSPIPKRF